MITHALCVDGPLEGTSVDIDPACWGAGRFECMMSRSLDAPPEASAYVVYRRHRAKVFGYIVHFWSVTSPPDDEDLFRHLASVKAHDVAEKIDVPGTPALS
jgi:hypothetical protein